MGRNLESFEEATDHGWGEDSRGGGFGSQEYEEGCHYGGECGRGREWASGE